MGRKIKYERTEWRLKNNNEQGKENGKNKRRKNYKKKNRRERKRKIE